MSSFSRDVALATEAYAAYLNAPRGMLDTEEQLLFDQDLARARAAMERAWLEATPVQEIAPGPGGVPPWRRPLALVRAITRVLGRP